MGEDSRQVGKKYVGRDVHQATIVVAVADEGRGAVRPSGTIKPTPPAVAPLVKKLGAAS